MVEGCNGPQRLHRSLVVFVGDTGVSGSLGGPQHGPHCHLGGSRWTIQDDLVDFLDLTGILLQEQH